MFTLPRSIISRDISSGNSRKTFIFCVRADNLSTSNACFIFGPVQFPSVLGVNLFIGGSFATWYIVVSSYWKNDVSNIIKQRLFYRIWKNKYIKT